MPDEKLDMGWVVLSRALLHSEIWLVKPFSKGQAWIDLILRANYKRGYITTKNGQIVEVDRGQCGHSVLALSEKWGWSRNKVTRFLAYLKDRKMIQQKVIANHSIITICNYGYYQDETTNDTINDTINEQQTIQQTDTNNKNNKNNKDNTLACAHEDFQFSTDETGNLSDAERIEWGKWLTVWQEMHGKGKPMNSYIRQGQLMNLLRVPAEYRLASLQKAVAGGWKNVCDVSKDEKRGKEKKFDASDPSTFMIGGVNGYE